MDKRLINSHDRFFKELFSKKEEVREFISKTLPTDLTGNLQLESLEMDNTEYIDKNLRASFSDLVYNCTYGEGTRIKISLLFEHKSYFDEYAHLQLLGYMLKIWETQIKQQEELTPVIPIIFYHGKQKWTKQSLDGYFKDLDESLQKFIPGFDYQLIDTSVFTDDQIINLFESLQLQIGILILKNIYDEQKLLEETSKIFSKVNVLLETEKGEHFFETIVSYIYYATKINTKEYIEKMKTISTKAEEKFISTAQRLEMKGIEKEKKRVAFSLLQQNVADHIILTATNLTKEQLDYLKTLKEYQIDLES